MKIDIIRINQLEPGDKFMKFGIWREVIKIKGGILTFRRSGQKKTETTSSTSKEFVQVERKTPEFIHRY